MICEDMAIINKLGLHARASTKLVQLAMQFECEVFILQNGAKINGKSILGLLLLAANKGKSIHVCADGPDEQLAISAIGELINNKFGEMA